MDLNQIGGALRIAIPMLLSFGVAKGWFTAADAGALSDAIVSFVIAAITIGMFVESLYANSKTAHIKSVQSLPDVTVVVGPFAPPVAQNAAEDAAQPNVIAKK